MSDVFISHAEEDAETALEIAQGLEAVGYTTWYYERDSYPGIDYLDQVDRAIERSRAVVVVISPDSVGSQQVEDEVKWAREQSKPLLPILKGISWADFQSRRPKWRMALGIVAAVRILAGGVGPILPRLTRGLEELGLMRSGTQGTEQEKAERLGRQEAEPERPEPEKAEAEHLAVEKAEAAGDAQRQARVDQVAGKEAEAKRQVADLPQLEPQVADSTNARENPRGQRHMNRAKTGHGAPLQKGKTRGFLANWFLLYVPSGLRAWCVHILFFFVFAVTLLGAIGAFIDWRSNPDNFESEGLLGFVIVALLAAGLRTLARHLD